MTPRSGYHITRHLPRFCDLGPSGHVHGLNVLDYVEDNLTSLVLGPGRGLEPIPFTLTRSEAEFRVHLTARTAVEVVTVVTDLAHQTMRTVSFARQEGAICTRVESSFTATTSEGVPRPITDVERARLADNRSMPDWAVPWRVSRYAEARAND